MLTEKKKLGLEIDLQALGLIFLIELDTLEAVIDFYDSGGIPNENLDPMIRPLGLSIKEKFYLLEFLKTFVGDNVDQLITDAFAQKIGDR